MVKNCQTCNLIEHTSYPGGEGGLTRVLSDICTFFLDCTLGAMDGKGTGAATGAATGATCIGCSWGGATGLGASLGAGVCL